MISFQPKNKAEVVNALGKSITDEIYKFKKKGTRRNPLFLYFMKSSPSFAVDDGGGLFAAPVDLVSGKLLRDWSYHGSGNSTINYLEQTSEGATAPENKAIIFIEYSHGYSSWTVTVVSPNITKQLGELV